MYYNDCIVYMMVMGVIVSASGEYIDWLLVVKADRLVHFYQ